MNTEQIGQSKTNKYDEVRKFFVSNLNMYFRIKYIHKKMFRDVTGKIVRVRKKSIIILVGDEEPKAIGFRQMKEYNYCHLRHKRMAYINKLIKSNLLDKFLE